MDIESLWQPSCHKRVPKLQINYTINLLRSKVKKKNKPRHGKKNQQRNNNSNFWVHTGRSLTLSVFNFLTSSALSCDLLVQPPQNPTKTRRASRQTVGPSCPIGFDYRFSRLDSRRGRTWRKKILFLPRRVANAHFSPTLPEDKMISK